MLDITILAILIPRDDWTETEMRLKCIHDSKDTSTEIQDM